MPDTKEKRPQQVFTLLVEVGRKPGDGLPDGSTGAALMIDPFDVSSIAAAIQKVISDSDFRSEALARWPRNRGRVGWC